MPKKPTSKMVIVDDVHHQKLIMLKAERKYASTNEVIVFLFDHYEKTKDNP